jgi:lysine-N-methylase
MSKKDARAILVPEYYKQFNCIGSVCEDTCCSGWSVTIDHKTYKKYNKLNDPVLKPMLDTHIKRNRKDPTDHNYARVVMNSENSCPFLSESKLCKIQERHGHKLLSNTCSSYPRILNRVDGKIELSGDTSCPEITRLALLNPDGIEFTEVELSEEEVTTIPTRKTSDTRLLSSFREYFWDLRIFIISLLQNRNFTLEDRLIVLGMFMGKIQILVNNKEIDKIPTTIITYGEILQDSNLVREMTSITTSNAVQMQLLKDLVDERIVEGVPSHRYAECFTQFLIGLNYREDWTVQQIAENYEELFQKYYTPFIANYEYVLENYLVNYVFNNLFPHKQKDVFEEFILLIINYSMIKFHLIGMCGYHKDLMNLDLMLKLIQSYSKVVEHSQMFLDDVRKLLKENGFNTMAYMAILIKN